jgi:hypothetical protein
MRVLDLHERSFADRVWWKLHATDRRLSVLFVTGHRRLVLPDREPTKAVGDAPHAEPRK